MIGGLSRRGVLVAAAALGGGFTVSCFGGRPGRERAGGFAPNAYVEVRPDGTVEFTMAKIEMGQGAQTGLAMILAEELDVDLAQVRLVQAKADAKRFGDTQVTGGSTSIQTSWEPLRTAGAGARAMLVAAAADRWNVTPESCETEPGVVVHRPSGRRVAYPELIKAAARRQPPAKPPLKAPATYRLVGRETARIEGPAKVDGSAVYGIDLRVPGMLVATLAIAPAAGGGLERVDEAAALKVPGMRQVVRLDDAVAAVADGYWAASQGLAALAPVWRAGPNAKVDTAAIVNALEQATRRRGAVAASVGDHATVPRQYKAVFKQPFLAHAPMEPMNCVVHVRDGGCEIWTGTQVAVEAQKAAAAVLGVPADKVVLHGQLIGGAFGRRLETDGVVRAVAIARQVRAPVKVIWSREQDTQHDMYRPAYVDRVAVDLDGAGRPLRWRHHIAGSSVMARTYPETFNGVDEDAIACVADPVYRLPNLRVEFSRVETGGIPTSWWRGVGATRGVFVMESVIDDLAAQAGADPIAYRRAILKEPRLLPLLDTVEAAAGWRTALPKGCGRGVAVQSAFGSVVAAVAEVSVEPDRAIRLRKVTVALDCGRVINPAGVRMQLEGGVVFGASAALLSAITIKDGAVVETGFGDYPVLRIDAAPVVECHLAESDALPGGVGEVGTAVIAPAITNAIFAATRERIYELPVSRTFNIWSAT